MEVCRACLSVEGELTPLNESLVTAYNLITDLNVDLMDSMPQFACENCLQALKFCMDFREKCIETETSLQQVLQKQVKPEENNSLKLEKKDLKNFKQEIKEDTVDDTEFDHCYDDGFSTFDELGIMLEKETTEDIKPKKRKYTKKKNKPFEILEDIILKSCDNDVEPKKRKCTKKEKGPEEIILHSCDVEPQKKKYTKKEKVPEEIVLHSCGLCKEIFTVKEIMTRHVETHKNERKCSLCSEEFDSWPAFVGHRMAHVPQKQKRCHICNMYMCSVTHCHSHYMMEHFDGEKTKMSCSHCSRSFDNPVRLKKHIYFCQPNKIYACDICGKITNTKSLLNSHMRSHMEIKGYKCDFHKCNFSSKHLGGIRDHKIRKHSPDKVKCKPCDRWFSSPAHMEKHKCNAIEKVCPICGIYVKHRLSKHLQSHSNIMPYKCERCPAAYKSSAALKAHLNRHDNNRTKQCEFCERRFYTSAVLIKHRRVHTGEKPYVCKICNRGFTGNHNLKVHMKVHGEDLVRKRIKPDIENLDTL